MTFSSMLSNAFLGGADGVMFEGQRLRVEMSKGSADVLGSSGAYGAPDRRDDRYSAEPTASPAHVLL